MEYKGSDAGKESKTFGHGYAKKHSELNEKQAKRLA